MFDPDRTIVELAKEHGMTDEWIAGEVLDTVAAFGMVIIAEEAENKGELLTLDDHITFMLEDEISDIEVTVRRVKREPIPKNRLN